MWKALHKIRRFHSHCLLYVDNHQHVISRSFQSSMPFAKRSRVSGMPTQKFLRLPMYGFLTITGVEASFGFTNATTSAAGIPGAVGGPLRPEREAAHSASRQPDATEGEKHEGTVRRNAVAAFAHRRRWRARHGRRARLLCARPFGRSSSARSRRPQGAGLDGPSMRLQHVRRLLRPPRAPQEG